jgi:predicted nucleotidyltransferase component of viral defense system
MTVEIINQRFQTKNVHTAQEEQHVLREILQEVALYALSRADFFKQGVFHGGTALRILYGLRRFSEDLDFVLKIPDPAFSWTRYENALRDEFAVFGIDLEVLDRSATRPVQALWLKDQSLGKILQLKIHLTS